MMQLARLVRFSNCVTHNVSFRKLLSVALWSRRFTQDVSLLGSDGYSKEEQMYILGIINGYGGVEIPSQIVGASNSKKIKTYISKVGHVDRLEDLLKVQGLGPRTVKKICDKLLEAKDGVPVVNKTDTSKSYQTPTSLTLPALFSDHVSNLRTIAAIQISVNTISWAMLDCHKKELLSWGVMDFATSSSNNSLHSLLATAYEVKSKLPEADIYIFEDVNWSNMAGSQLSVKVHMSRAQLTAILVTIIENLGNGRDEMKSPKVAFLRSRLTGRLFRRHIGSERVSSQSVVENILQQRVSIHHSNIFIGPMMKTVYFEHKGHYKESLCEPVLLSVAFMDLVILKRIDLLQLDKPRKGKMSPTDSSSVQQ